MDTIDKPLTRVCKKCGEIKELSHFAKCKTCNKEPEGHKSVLCLDHCHTTLKIRGLLCDNCNAGLGKFKDDTDLLEQAVNYLNNHG